jgi:hypothetical protein
MNETSLRDLFERVIEPEPPIGTFAQDGIRVGIRLHRRRRVQRAIASAAAVAVTCGAVVAVTNLSGRHGSPAASAGRGTVYVLGDPVTCRTRACRPSSYAYVTPISAATNAAGAPIAVNVGIALSNLSDIMTATPDGKTIYVPDGSAGVTPVFTATGRVGKLIPSPQASQGLSLSVVAAPDSKTVFVIASDGEVMPISTATSTTGPPFWVNPPGTPDGQASVTSTAMTPNGKTLYVDVGAGGASYVVPVDTTTDRPGKPIRLLPGFPQDTMVVTSDGSTVYVVGEQIDATKIVVIPISTATNTAGPAVVVSATGHLGYGSNPVVMTGDGRYIYIATADPSSLIPFSTATDSAGTPINFGNWGIFALAAAPDGRTVYAASGRITNHSIGCPKVPDIVTPVSTATNRRGKPIQVACYPYTLTVSPDSKTVYVGSYYPGRGGVVTPVVAATGRAGPQITVAGSPQSILVTP